MMRAASLTGALLVSRGNTVAFGEGLDLERAGATIEALPRRPTQRQGTGRQNGHTRVSLRMNSPRHLRVRLAAAQLGLSAHGVMVAAIDHYLDNVLPTIMAGHCACLEQGRAPSGNCTALGFGRTHPDRTS
jgi:hypothetical protein